MSENIGKSDLIIEAIPIEEQIDQELVKHNVTEAKIAELKEKYLPLKINGIDDKETYLQIKEARKECKSLRIAAEKLCKIGREEATRVSKLWIAKEKDVAGRIGEVEDHLEKQEKEFEAALKKAEDERKRKIEGQWILRTQILTQMGVLYSDGYFALGEISFEMSVIKECEPEIWEESILPKYKAEYEKVQAEELEKERIKREREAELTRQQEEMERKQNELEVREAALLKIQEEQERKQREEEDRKAAEGREKLQAKWGARIKQLTDLGLTFDFSDDHYKGYDCFVAVLDIKCFDDEKWSRTIDEIGRHIDRKKEEAEQLRLAEIEAQKEAERYLALKKSRNDVLRQYGVTIDPEGDVGSYSDERWDALMTQVKGDYEKQQREKWEAEQAEKRKQEEQKKAEEMALSSDKVKWWEIIHKIGQIEIYEMRSSQYRKKAAELRKLMDQIKAL